MDFHLLKFNSVLYGKHSIRYFGPYTGSRLDTKIKDKSTLQSFSSRIRRINLADLISDHYGSCLTCSSWVFGNFLETFLAFFCIF